MVREPETAPIVPARCDVTQLRAHVVEFESEPLRVGPPSALRDKYAIIVTRRADGSDRLIAKRWKDSSLTEYSVPAGRFDQILDAYCTWVESLARAS